MIKLNDEVKIPGSCPLSASLLWNVVGKQVGREYGQVARAGHGRGNSSAEGRKL